MPCAGDESDPGCLVAYDLGMIGTIEPKRDCGDGLLLGLINRSPHRYDIRDRQLS